MSIKPLVDKTTVLRLLQQHFGNDVSQLQEIHGGWLARTYGFHADGRARILRLVTANLSQTLAKEIYVYRQFAAPQIPIPPIRYTGTLGTLHYAISDRMPGTPSDQLAKAEYERAIPAIMGTLDAIHRQDVSDTAGYGLFDSQGAGQWPSWRAYLASIREEEDETDFYGRWHVLFETTFLEHDFWFRLYDQMVRLLPFCPEERYLLHGDYGYNNLLIADGRVTAVLDWGDARYGDPLFDVQWLASWLGPWDFPGRFRAYYRETGRSMPDYEERSQCYMAYIALDGLRFFAKANNYQAYQQVKHRIIDAFGW